MQKIYWNVLDLVVAVLIFVELIGVDNWQMNPLGSIVVFALFFVPWYYGSRWMRGKLSKSIPATM